MVGDDIAADVEELKVLGKAAVWCRPTLDEPAEVSAEVADGLWSEYTIDSVTELPDLPLFAQGTAK